MNEIQLKRDGLSVVDYVYHDLFNIICSLALLGAPSRHMRIAGCLRRGVTSARTKP